MGESTGWSIQGNFEIISRVGGETARAFVPNPLPPDPPIEWTTDLRSRFDQALLAQKRLEQLEIVRELTQQI